MPNDAKQKVNSQPTSFENVSQKNAWEQLDSSEANPIDNNPDDSTDIGPESDGDLYNEQKAQAIESEMFDDKSTPELIEQSTTEVQVDQETQPTPATPETQSTPSENFNEKILAITEADAANTPERIYPYNAEAIDEEDRGIAITPKDDKRIYPYDADAVDEENRGIATTPETPEDS